MNRNWLRRSKDPDGCYFTKILYVDQLKDQVSAVADKVNCKDASEPELVSSVTDMMLFIMKNYNIEKECNQNERAYLFRFSPENNLSKYIITIGMSSLATVNKHHFYIYMYQYGQNHLD